MAVPFDHIACAYESVLSRSAVGQLQRKEAWAYLQNVLSQLDGLEMLELNLGSEEDALMFSDKGYNIIATDVSAETTKLTQEKAEQYSLPNKITSQYLDLDCVQESLLDKKYDLIFSNFGGLNSINPESLQKFLAKLPSLLNENGRFVGVIMTRFCLVECFYHLSKLQFKKAFRRWTSKEVVTSLNDSAIKTWYYNPGMIKGWASNYFDVQSIKPVGVVLPPYYLSNFFLRKKRLLLRLNKLEKRFNHSMFASIADHFIIDLKLKAK